MIVVGSKVVFQKDTAARRIAGVGKGGSKGASCLEKGSGGQHGDFLNAMMAAPPIPGVRARGIYESRFFQS